MARRKRVIGTAGHIDHGKTSLVRALTGIDTDRLPEEKKRGITIDLGFAPMRLGDGEVLGVVDVPGHEAFVRTMLAGATGIDIALLVIAADEGPMPQTLEHLAILELLEVREVVVALTKADLVDQEWLALVTQEVKDLLEDRLFGECLVFPTSVMTGDGIGELREHLRGCAVTGLSVIRAPDDLFRMPVDRVFSVKGTGTVVTGTVWSGALARDEIVRILPQGKSARVRSLQNHGAGVERIEPGTRAAVALAGVDVSDIERGATLVTHPAWQPTQVLRANVTLLEGAPTLRPRTRVRFHLATSDVGARVVAAGAPLEAGQARPVKIILDAPAVARAGDRFVLRSASPLATIGGGVVTDPFAPRRGKPFPAYYMEGEDRLAWYAAEAGLHGVPEATLPVRGSGPPRPDHTSKSLTRIGDSWYATDALDVARTKLLSAVRAFHGEKPLEPGVPREDIRSRLGVEAALFDQVVSELVARKKLEAAGALLRLPGRAAELTAAQQKMADQILAELTAAGREPPSVGELEQRLGQQVMSVLRHLERQKRVVQVEEGRYYAPEAVRELLGRLEAGMSGKGEVAPTDLKEVLGFSRKYLIPFLEYCDKRGYTQRRGNGRVWKGTTPKQ
jgi:selenocysteine-specific elongation factor